MQAAPTMASPMAQHQGWPFSVKRCTPTIGADIEGVDLGQPLDDETYGALRQALLKFKVLFFRGQDITPAQHVGVARRFGELETHAMLRHHPDHPELIVFGHNDQDRGRENLFHSDVSWPEIPSMRSMLRCIECPAGG